MANPLKKMKQVQADYKQLDAKDRKKFWVDGILNNALYILMAVFIIYTASVRENFLTLGSFANLITQVAAYLPMALGIAGCIVLTGTDLSAGRVSGLTAAVAAVMLQKSDFCNNTPATAAVKPATRPAERSVPVNTIQPAIPSAIGKYAATCVIKFAKEPIVKKFSLTIAV